MELYAWNWSLRFFWAEKFHHFLLKIQRKKKDSNLLWNKFVAAIDSNEFRRFPIQLPTNVFGLHLLEPKRTKILCFFFCLLMRFWSQNSSKSWSNQSRMLLKKHNSIGSWSWSGQTHDRIVIVIGSNSWSWSNRARDQIVIMIGSKSHVINTTWQDQSRDWIWSKSYAYLKRFWSQN